MAHFSCLAINEPHALTFGRAPHPVTTRRGLVIGGGTVYPELNFTLPALAIDETTWPKVVGHYNQIIEGALARAIALEAQGVVIEFETLPPMTERPEWALEIVQILLAAMEDAYATRGLRSALRVTPNDNRDMVRPPQMRGGPHWETMRVLFEGAAARGADLLSIESVGGKEVHDNALMAGDVGQSLFALTILGARDMEFVWGHIVAIARAHGVVAAGDTACGFGNTAMVMAEQGLIPRVFAAVVRAVTAVRSLVAYEQGAVGPGKDCGYENPILKTITGFPMSMEGKSAACAHLSSVGNVAAAACDCWSNESVQNVKLLGGMAPTCSMEQLIYDCRLFNQALADGPEGAATLQRWLVASDAPRDPQAFVLTPASAIAIATAIVAESSPYAAGCAAARTALRLIREGARSGAVRVSERESPWLNRMEERLAELPADEGRFIDMMLAAVDLGSFVAADYGL